MNREGIIVPKYPGTTGAVAWLICSRCKARTKELRTTAGLGTPHICVLCAPEKADDE